MDTRIVIDFNNFTNAEKADLITYLHQCVIGDRQTNWDLFHDQFLVQSPERARQRHFVKRTLNLAIIGFAAAFAVLWLSGRGVHFLIMSVIIGAWAALRNCHAQEAA